MLQGIVSGLGRSYEIISCTKRAVFDSTLPTLSGASLIVTSVLSNFICDAGSRSPDRILDVSNAEIFDHVQVIHAYVQANPGVRVAIVPPLARSDPDWFNPYLPCFISYLINEVGKLGSHQIRYLSPFVAPAHFFESDGVHLTQESGFQFIKFIIRGVDQLFTLAEVGPFSSMSLSQVSGLTSPHQSRIMPPSASFAVPSPSFQYAQGGAYASAVGSDTSRFQNPASTTISNVTRSYNPNLAVEFVRVSTALETLTGLTSNLSSEVKVRRNQDNLIFARLKEDRDYEFNRNRENRFTVTGLVLPSIPSDPKERKEFFRVKLNELFAEACPELELDPKPDVVDVYVNMRYGQESPFLEARMNSVEAASAFRVAASQLARDESPNFKDLFIANAVTLSTRVRIEILRAISKALTTDETEAFVQGFSSRPLLHYHTLEHCHRRIEGTGRSYTFVEAVSKFGDQATPYSLLPAYRRARPAFIGCMEQYFVVLKEGEPPGLSGPLSSRGGGSFGSRGYRGARGGGARGGWRGGRSQSTTPRGNLARSRQGFKGRALSQKRRWENDDATETPSKKSAAEGDPMQE